MSQIVELKIKLDLLRVALDDELAKGSSIFRVREIHTAIKDIEKDMIQFETISDLRN